MRLQVDYRIICRTLGNELPRCLIRFLKPFVLLSSFSSKRGDQFESTGSRLQLTQCVWQPWPFPVCCSSRRSRRQPTTTTRRSNEADHSGRGSSHRRRRRRRPTRPRTLNPKHHQPVNRLDVSPLSGPETGSPVPQSSPLRRWSELWMTPTTRRHRSH